MEAKVLREVTGSGGKQWKVAFLNRDLEVAQLLYERKSYNQIASLLKVSPKTISKVRRKVEAGVIKIGENGKARYARNAKQVLAVEEVSNKGLVELEYKLMRALGSSSPEEALKLANEFAVKLNPYQRARSGQAPIVIRAKMIIRGKNK